MLLESLLTKLTAAGLATKAAAGGAAVVVAASAAGAADALPTPAQDTFDRLVVEDVEDVDAQDVTVEETVESEGTVESEETTEDSAFGERVSGDATGEADGEPGVDGRQIACEASEGRSGTCEAEGAEDEVAEADAESTDGFGDRVSRDATGESDGEPGVDGKEISAEARARSAGEGEEESDDLETAEDDGSDDERDDDVDEGGPEGTPGAAAANANRPGDQG